MKPRKHSSISRAAFLVALAPLCQVALANGSGPQVSKEVQAIVDFQCHGAKTSKQAEANYANMARGYTDAHPVMECLKKKIEELKAAGK